MALKYLKIGDTRTNKQGYKYEIIEINNCKSVFIRFLIDGSVKETTADYAHKGVVGKQRFFIGNIYKDKYGDDIKLINYKTYDKITVQWSDGTTRVVTGYQIENGLVIREDYSQRLNPSVKVGDEFRNNQGTLLRVKEYRSYSNVLVEVLGSIHHDVVCNAGNLIKGNVHDKYAPSVAGKGIIGDATVDVKSKEYKTWTGMIKRCYVFYDYNPRAKINYEDCSVCEDWLHYENFLKWFKLQNLREDWQLDKDLLVKGNREYSPDKCVFLPREINTFLTLRKNDRGEYPVGVTYHSRLDKFEAGCNRGGKNLYLGLFSDPVSAFNAYKTEKESFAKELAERWKTLIDKRAYDALLSWTVNIDD